MELPKHSQMTEKEWLSSKDGMKMGMDMIGSAPLRQDYLIVAACLRRFWVPDKDVQTGVTVDDVDNVAAGWPTRSDPVQDNWFGPGICSSKPGFVNVRISPLRADCDSEVVADIIRDVLGNIFRPAPLLCCGGKLAVLTSMTLEEARQRNKRNLWSLPDTGLIYDTAPPEAWLAWNDGFIGKLAEAIYNEHRFKDMPVFADALEKAGCDNQDILSHCRLGGLHVRGCFVIDHFVRTRSAWRWATTEAFVDSWARLKEANRPSMSLDEFVAAIEKELRLRRKVFRQEDLVKYATQMWRLAANVSLDVAEHAHSFSVNGAAWDDTPMTEECWLESSDPRRMLGWLWVNERPSQRKLRLCACAFSRAISHLLTYDWSREALEATEEYLAGRLTPEDAVKGWKRLQEGFANRNREFKGGNHPSVDAELKVSWASLPLDPKEPKNEKLDARPRPLLAAQETSSIQTAGADYGSILRDIFGNPFRAKPYIDPACLTWNNGAVVRLAQEIYDQRSFDRMPELGAALRAAGCTKEEVLMHCERGSPHVRGCWVVDLLLGRNDPARKRGNR